MSQENVEIVRRGFEAFNRGGLDAVLGFYDPEVEWVTTDGYVEAGTYRGHEGVLRYLGSLAAEFEDVRLEPEELIEVGEQVVAPIRATATGKRSGVPVEFTITFVYWLRDGLAVRVENYAAKAEALEALARRE
jgi:ketosteroid isomerase-like protein